MRPIRTAFSRCNTDDAVFVTPVSEQIRGPAAIAGFVKRLIDVGFKDHTFNVIDAHSVGNTAYSFSSYTVKNGSSATNVATA
jgi:ketosteroid isomerase-like protein